MPPEFACALPGVFHDPGLARFRRLPGRAILVRMAEPRNPALFVDLAWASQRVAGMRGRLQKVRFLVDALAKVPDEEIAAAVGWLVEEPLCGPLGVGPAQLWELSQTAAPTEPTVT